MPEHAQLGEVNQPLESVRQLTPATCELVIRGLDLAVEKLAEWGLRFGVANRVDLARRILENTNRQGVLPTNQSGLAMLGRAAQLAAELYQISTGLGEDSNPIVARELLGLLGGSLDQETSDRRAYELQSQFWVGTLLLQSRLRTTIFGYEPRTSKPDFIVQVGSLDCAVEAKRPHSKQSTIRALGRAANQLRDRSEPGVIFLDLSEILFTNTRMFQVEGSDNEVDIRSEHSSLSSSLVDCVETYRQSDKFAKTIMICSFVRFWFWTHTPEPEMNARMLLQIYRRPHAYSGLVAIQSDMLQSALIRGVRSLSGNEPMLSYS